MSDTPETRSPALGSKARDRRSSTAAAVLATALAVALAAPALAQSGAPSTPELQPDQRLPDQGLEAPLDETPLDDRADDPDAGAGSQDLADEADADAPPSLDAIEDPGEALETAFDRLRAEDESVWRPAQSFITKAWEKSGSDSMDLLLLRGRKALEAEDWPLAIEHLTDLVNLAPDFAEGWNARATAHFRNDDFGAALADIAETLALEPRHFGALAGLGLILQEVGEEKKAVAAYRKALEVNPHLDGPAEAVDRLAPTVDGRDA